MILRAITIWLTLHAGPVPASSTALELLATIGPRMPDGRRLAGPFGVSVASNRHVLVSDDLGHRIYHLDASLALVRVLGEELALAYTDAAILTDRGYLVADTGNDRLLLLDRDASLVRAIRGWGWWRGRLASPRSLAGGFDDEVLVADWGNHRVRRVGADGTLIRTYGGPGMLDHPIDAIHVPSLGVVVSDHRQDRLQVFSEDGRLTATIGRSGSEPGALRRPSGLALGPDGVIWVADSGNARLQAFAVDGRPRATFGGTAGARLVRPTDLAFGPGERLFVADPGRHAVLVFGRRR